MEEINYKKLKNLGKFKFLEKDSSEPIVVTSAKKYSTVTQPGSKKSVSISQNYSTLNPQSRKKSIDKSLTLRPRKLLERPKSVEKTD